MKHAKNLLVTAIAVLFIGCGSSGSCGGSSCGGDDTTIGSSDLVTGSTSDGTVVSTVGNTPVVTGVNTTTTNVTTNVNTNVNTTTTNVTTNVNTNGGFSSTPGEIQTSGGVTQVTTTSSCQETAPVCRLTKPIWTSFSEMYGDYATYQNEFFLKRGLDVSVLQNRDLRDVIWSDEHQYFIVAPNGKFFNYQSTELGCVQVNGHTCCLGVATLNACDAAVRVYEKLPCN